MPWSAWSRLTQTRSPATRSGTCSAASSCSLVQRRAVNQNGVPPSARSPVPPVSVSSAHRTSARAPFSCGLTYGVWSASTSRRHCPSIAAARVSGYASPGPPPNHRASPYAEGSPNRMPSRGSGTRQSPSGTTDTVSPSRSPAAVHRYVVRSPRSQPAGATRVRTVSASPSLSTASRRWRIRCSPSSRQRSP